MGTKEKAAGLSATLQCWWRSPLPHLSFSLLITCCVMLCPFLIANTTTSAVLSNNTLRQNVPVQNAHIRVYSPKTLTKAMSALTATTHFTVVLPIISISALHY